MSEFKHFIITRFNLKQTIWKSDKRGVKVNDPDWLSSRYELFETYCFPSLVMQHEQDFIWLVFFDTNTPASFKSKNQILRSKFKNFVPVYVSSFSEFEDRLDSEIGSYLDRSCRFVISTRLDNDDCFHKDAIKTIQDHFIAQDRSIIDLVKGLTLQITDGYKLSLKQGTVSGPFISLIEEVKKDMPLLTVYDREHLHWKDDAHFVTVADQFLWLQIIHERNVSNTLGQDLSSNTAYLKGFDFLGPIRFRFSYRLFIFLKKTRLYPIYKTIKNAYFVFDTKKR